MYSQDGINFNLYVQEKYSLKIWLSYAISFTEKNEFPCYLKSKTDGPVLPVIQIHMCKTDVFWVGYSIFLVSRLIRETLSIIFIFEINT